MSRVDIFVLVPFKRFSSNQRCIYVAKQNMLSEIKIVVLLWNIIVIISKYIYNHMLNIHF